MSKYRDLRVSGTTCVVEQFSSELFACASRLAVKHFGTPNDRIDPSETVLRVRGRVSALAVVSCPCKDHRDRFDIEVNRWAASEDEAPATSAQRDRMMAALHEIGDAPTDAAWGKFYTVAWQAVSDESRRQSAGTEFGSRPERLFLSSRLYTAEQVEVGAIMVKCAVGRGRSVATKYFATGQNRLDAANLVRAVAAANPGRPGEVTAAVRVRLATMPSEQLVETIEGWARITRSAYPQKWLELRQRCAAETAAPLTYVTPGGEEAEVAVEQPGADPEQAAGRDMAELVAEDPGWICLGILLRKGVNLDVDEVVGWVLEAAKRKRSNEVERALVLWLLMFRRRGGSSAMLRAFRSRSEQEITTMVERAGDLFFGVGSLCGIGEALYADARLRRGPDV